MDHVQNENDFRKISHLESFAIETNRFLNFTLFSFDISQVIQWICMRWTEAQSSIVAFFWFFNLSTKQICEEKRPQTLMMKMTLENL